MKKAILPLLLIALLIGACGGGIRVHIEKKNYETDRLTVSAEIPQISGMKHTDLQDTINNQYKTDIDGWIAQIQTEADENPSSNPYELVVTQSIKTNKDGFLSMVSEVYRYTGGAHGTTAWLAKNIDDNAGKVITLADLFADEDYKTVLNRIMQQMVEEHPEQYGDLWEKPIIGEEQGFYIENKRLVIYYPPYELSYYARGFVEFPIALKDIETYLNPEYKFLA
jgi:hypothetical protein